MFICLRSMSRPIEEETELFPRYIACQLSLLLILGAPLPSPAIAGTSAQESESKIKQEVGLIEAGKIVEVKTKTKEKHRGRLGAIQADSFELQTTEGGKIQTQSLRFDQVKSVKQIQMNAGMSRGAKTAIWICVGVGGYVLLMVTLLATGAINN